MPSWMNRLARHYRAALLRFPDKQQLILFDIDGTIVDSRESVRALLQAYDRTHATAYFTGLTANAVTVTEDHLQPLLADVGVPAALHSAIQEWCSAHRWSAEAALASHRPYTGVLEVIRWFQLQPRTSVGLNTARDETLRETTLRSLNAIGREFKVRFSSELLHMNPGGWEEEIQRSKAAAIDSFGDRGYHVFAMIDNEPENLRAVAREHPEETLLLLHVDTIFRTRRTRLPPEAVSGTGYRLADIVRTRRDLPRHITFVWHGVNGPATLRQFLASGIAWGEVDIRSGPGGEIVCDRESDGAGTLVFQDALAAVRGAGRFLRIELRDGGRLADRCIDALHAAGCRDKDLWFHCDPEVTGAGAIGDLGEAFPGALIQVPGEAVARACGEGGDACEAVAAARELGARRLSFSYMTPNLGATLDFLDRCGMTADIRRETELDDFLRSVLLMPASVASDFRFPPGWDFSGKEE
ncbi:MAG TPA: hypothetical protein ENN44_03620 [Methanoculleus sp.]|nr:hypothetical protein [Methanoculleus sp.]